MNIFQQSSQFLRRAVRIRTGKPALLALSALLLGGAAFPATAAQWWSATPKTTIGKATVNVRTKGALGNGVHNDTAAIQAAINSLPASGGTVYIPAGRYMIDATRSISLRSHTHLRMAPAAQLVVIPNNQRRYFAIKVWNVNNVVITGGQVIGDRARHKGTGGEWGYGINIQASSHVLVDNVRVSDFWGDGLWIGAKGRGRKLHRSDYVTVNHVVSSNNRRQGLSIGPARHVYIVNSTFKNTHGTRPESGIDIEPMSQGTADTIRIERSVMTGNRGNGIEMHNNVSRVQIVNNTMTTNRGFGVLAVHPPYLTITGNHATRNGLSGVRVSGKTHDDQIKGNVLQYNSTNYMAPTRKGGGTQRDLQIGGQATRVTVQNNKLS